MTPEHAEEISKEMGHGPIAEEFDYLRYHVGTMPAWTLPMSMAWILWRDMEEVTKLHDPYRQNNFRWEPFTIDPPTSLVSGSLPLPPRRSFRLKRLEPATFVSILMLSNNRGKVFQDAKQKLLSELVSGNITATALDAVTGEFIHIDPRRWAHFDFDKSFNTRTFLNSHGTPQITEVRVLRADIQNLWPKEEPYAAAAALAGTPAEQGIAIPKAKRGPKLKYDGAAYIANAVDFLEDNGGISLVDPNFTRQTVLDHMVEWCKKRWKTVPGETWQKDHLRKAIALYEEDTGAN
ncbi:hypothetical protein [Agrobacterium rosae]|uniref:hypothetical protein n=1 Tax=Agrobacterium rosae TaxID=1972867 RepID=UPI003BA0D9ED